MHKWFLFMSCTILFAACEKDDCLPVSVYEGVWYGDYYNFRISSTNGDTLQNNFVNQIYHVFERDGGGYYTSTQNLEPDRLLWDIDELNGIMIINYYNELYSLWGGYRCAIKHLSPDSMYVVTEPRYPTAFDSIRQVYLPDSNSYYNVSGIAFTRQ